MVCNFLFPHVSVSLNDLIIVQFFVGSVFMRINCNFVTMVGLTNDGYLIRNLRVERHRGSEEL